MGELTIKHDGDTWRVIGFGRINDEGKTYCHLASTTRGRQQRNGFVPAQISDWVDLADATDNRDPITSYYEDRNNSGQSPLEARR